MKNKSSIVSILIITTLLVSSIGMIAGSDPLDPIQVSANAPDSVSVGDTFPVYFNISYVEHLSAVTFYVTFDSSIISFIDSVEGNIGGDPVEYMSAAFLIGSTNTLGVTVYCSQPGLTGEGTLGTINFEAISAGSSAIDISNSQVSTFDYQGSPETTPSESIDDSVQVSLQTHTLTINTVGSGTVNKNPDQTTYTHETIVTLTANPAIGWDFDHWENDLIGSTNPETITMDGDKTVTAVFTRIEYTLTLTTSGTGTGTIQASPVGPYHYGDTITIWANASADSNFAGFTGDLTGINTPQTITIDGNKNINAEFTIKEYTLTISTIGNGTVNKNPDQTTYTHGTIVTLTATPDDNNNIFHHWSGDLTGYQDTITITMDSDKEVTANFTLRGDVNYDGGVGAADITYVQEIMFGNLEEIPAANVDQDQNGNINVLDIQTIEQIFLGYQFP